MRWRPNRVSAVAGGIPPWTLAFGAILSVQLGSALSIELIGQVGAAGTAWLRLSIGALIFIAIARPTLPRYAANTFSRSLVWE